MRSHYVRSRHRKQAAVTVVLMAFVSLWVSSCAKVAERPAGSKVLGSGTETPLTSRPPGAAIALPPQGLYDSCIPSSPECLGHLDILAAKGFKLVLNYGQLYGDTAAQIAYADRASSVGMQVIWPILYTAGTASDWLVTKYPELGADSQCTDNPCMIRHIVNMVKNHPATWGYYVADEVKPEEYARMKPWTDLIVSLDPNHPRLFVTAGSNDPMEQYYGFYSYMRDLADVFGPDYYPYGYIDEGTNLTRFTGATASHAQHWADKLGGQSAIVLQAFTWARYADVPLCLPWPQCAPFPSFAQMKAQRDQTLLSSHPALILWWTYADILKTENPAAHLDDLAAAAFSPPPDQQVTPPQPPDYCPVGWSCDDIGNPALTGGQSIGHGAWIVQGAGWDIWARPWVRADQFHYIWQRLDGDGRLGARIIAQLDTDKLAKAGIMLRKTVDPVSPYYAIYVTPGNGIRAQYRQDYGNESQDLAILPGNVPIYLRVIRTGAIFSAEASNNGADWVTLPHSTLELESLSGALMAGLAIVSRDPDRLGSATFTQLEFP